MLLILHVVLLPQLLDLSLLLSILSKCLLLSLLVFLQLLNLILVEVVLLQALDADVDEPGIRMLIELFRPDDIRQLDHAMCAQLARLADSVFIGLL